MSSPFAAFRETVRAATWRRCGPLAREPRAWDVALPILACLGLFALSDWLLAKGDAKFQLYGINALLALAAAEVAVIALFSSVREGWTRFVVLLWLSNLAHVALIALTEGVECFVPSERDGGELDWAVLTGAAALAWLVWSIGAAQQVFAGLAAPLRRPGVRAAGLIGASVLAGGLLPIWPLFAGTDFERAQANLWEIVQHRDAVVS